ncbi:GNAT family N-acetyltransferase [Cryobacterium arcticum]|uniref:N-acetyltransferase n=1 Tax=Cryobacterium arcticum TaxID=670052 RepID=A0A317ZZH0_9MICO|nr:GNAT family N-acetyltransferase [Cryobacterium arcticum]PXA72797.1 N-acetyltransferase [Cryobacterium arcticum]
MQTEPSPIQVRPADLTGPDSGVVSHLVEAYLRRTEFEKATHLSGLGAEADLPKRYRDEVETPARAYENATVYLAELNLLPVGVIVVQHNRANHEIKRVWVEPSARGQRVGSALIDAVLSQQDRPARLTVWDWRRDAIQLYRSRGFVPVASWEDRPRLVCMELPSTSPENAR